MEPAKSTFLKPHLDAVYKDSVLRKPMSPSVWVGDVSYKPITRIKMSCGGGIGGSTWFEYIERIPLETVASNEHGYLAVRTWDGRKIVLNKFYMVKADELTIASAVLRSSNHHFPLGDYTHCYLVEDGHTIQLSDECRPVL